MMFSITAKDKTTYARSGVLRTLHGNVQTPFFMPVATKATVKHICVQDLYSMKARAIICNAFVLHLRPGHKALEKLGGIHKFMNFKGVIFTDSGGFQMYKESFLVRTVADGIWFKSPFDGKKHFVTPETDMEIQRSIGSDVAMCLDSMPLIEQSKEAISDSVEKTTDWARRCRLHHLKTRKSKGQLLFAISQGGIYPDLRKKSISELLKMDFDGYSAGGLALGEPKEEMFRMIRLQKSLMPEKKPFYVMGLGSPVDLLEAISYGADIFDSRFPTQNARRGTLFTSKGKLRIKRMEYTHDTQPIDRKCKCFVCRNYSRAYIHFQLRQSEGAGYRLATYHNLFYLQGLMEQARGMIKAGRFSGFQKSMARIYSKADEENLIKNS